MDQTASNGTDIFLSRSTDGGATWSPPLRVNDDPARVANDQFNQWLAVDPSNGSVNLSWNDTRRPRAPEHRHLLRPLHRRRAQLHQERAGHHRPYQRNMLQSRPGQPVRRLRGDRRPGRIHPPPPGPTAGQPSPPSTRRSSPLPSQCGNARPDGAPRGHETTPSASPAARSTIPDAGSRTLSQRKHWRDHGTGATIAGGAQASERPPQSGRAWITADGQIRSSRASPLRICPSAPEHVFARLPFPRAAAV